jgi:hypothetical protein
MAETASVSRHVTPTPAIRKIGRRSEVVLVLRRRSVTVVTAMPCVWAYTTVIPQSPIQGNGIQSCYLTSWTWFGEFSLIGAAEDGRSCRLNGRAAAQLFTSRDEAAASK